MIPGSYHFQVYKGETHTEVITRSGVSSATSWAAKIEIRAIQGDTSSTLYQTLSSPSSGIVLTSDGTNLIITVTITAAQTAAFTFTQAYYDLKLTKPDSTVEYLLFGAVIVTNRTTS